MSMEEFQDLFNKFAAYGHTSANTAPEIDNNKFAKFTRDCKLLDKKLVPAHVDLAWSKICPRGQRKVGFDAFVQGCKILAEKKYGSADDLDKLIAQCVKIGGPQTNATKASTAGWVAKQTDTKLYTGAHQQRFDAEGHGRGLSGRDRPANNDLSDLLDRSEADVRGVKKA